MKRVVILNVEDDVKIEGLQIAAILRRESDGGGSATFFSSDDSIRENNEWLFKFNGKAERVKDEMQVELEGDGYADNGQIYYDYGKCPKCGWDFEDGDKDWEEPYCCHCGQKLHWFESEDKG